eukprot:6490610-Amphidinium_carterae.1
MEDCGPGVCLHTANYSRTRSPLCVLHTQAIGRWKEVALTQSLQVLCFAVLAMDVSRMRLRVSTSRFVSHERTKYWLRRVRSDMNALVRAPADIRGNRTVVLAAVSYYGHALRHASFALRGDREVVLAAVRESGTALEGCSFLLHADASLVREAVAQDEYALLHAAPALLLDPGFLMPVKQQLELIVVRFTMMSGRQLVLPCHGTVRGVYTQDFLIQFVRLHLRKRVRLDCCHIMHRGVVIPKWCELLDFPGLAPFGQVSDYDLVIHS